jgi:hypothetical protein
MMGASDRRLAYLERRPAARRLAPNVVTAEVISYAAVTAPAIDDNAVTTPAIDDNAVTNPAIGDSAINNRTIETDAINARTIRANSITAEEISANAITAREISANAITASEISANAITAGKISADAITAREIAANAITASEISANAITANKIRADAITAGKIAANAVSAREILAGSITASKIVAGGITANVITSGRIDASDVTITNLSASNITTGTLSGRVVRTTGGANRIQMSDTDDLRIYNGGSIAAVFTSGQRGSQWISSGTYMSIGSGGATLKMGNTSAQIRGNASTFAWEVDGILNANNGLSVDSGFTLNSATTSTYAAVSQLWAVGGGNSFTKVPKPSSDLRLKRKVEPITIGLNFINSLTPVSFEWKDDDKPTTQFGVIAQDVERSLFENKIERYQIIHRDGEKYEGEDSDKTDIRRIEYNQFVAPLIKAVQELSTRVQELEKIIEEGK